MRIRILAFCLCLIASGCVYQPLKQRQVVWLASTVNGDKPGIGIKLIKIDGQLDATFFGLDPNKPHDFKAGRPFPTEVVHSNESELHFVVSLDDNGKPRKDEFVIALQGRLKGNRVSATLHDVRGEGSPITLTFVRQK